jgi:hypothetical protein
LERGGDGQEARELEMEKKQFTQRKGTHQLWIQDKAVISLNYSKTAIVSNLLAPSSKYLPKFPQGTKPLAFPSLDSRDYFTYFGIIVDHNEVLIGNM